MTNATNQWWQAWDALRLGSWPLVSSFLLFADWISPWHVHHHHDHGHCMAIQRGLRNTCSVFLSRSRCLLICFLFSYVRTITLPHFTMTDNKARDVELTTVALVPSFSDGHRIGCWWTQTHSENVSYCLNSRLAYFTRVFKISYNIFRAMFGRKEKIWENQEKKILRNL